jgi:hypothetical protein
MIVAALPAEASPLDSVPSMDVVRSRLELTPEQEAQLSPLFQQRLAEVQDARARLEQATSRQDKRALLRQAKQRQHDFNQRVESVLTPPQKDEWRQIRDETREKLKKRYEEKRE